MAVAKKIEKTDEKVSGVSVYKLFYMLKRDNEKIYEFKPRVEGYCSYRVGFDEVNSDAEAWQAVQNALVLEAQRK